MESLISEIQFIVLKNIYIVKNTLYVQFFFYEIPCFQGHFTHTKSVKLRVLNQLNNIEKILTGIVLPTVPRRWWKSCSGRFYLTFLRDYMEGSVRKLSRDISHSVWAMSEAGTKSLFYFLEAPRNFFREDLNRHLYQNIIV